MNNEDLKKQILEVVPLLEKLLHADPATRQLLQQRGLNLVPANMYSTVPSISDVSQSFEYNEDAPPYLDASIFDAARLREELLALIPFSEEFNPPQHGNEETCKAYFWKNSQFSYSDAMSYYAYIRKVKPKTVLEIGSGFSSLIALEALKKNGVGRLTCIEPFPRPFLTSLHREGQLDLIELGAQQITSDTINSLLDDGDILFVDSTHTVKTGSDCLHIYLRLIPKLQSNVYIHIHDIFLPFGMPQSWLLDWHFYWTEQYLLLALLIDNPKTSVIYGSAYHSRFNADLLQSLMRGRFGPGGASFWIRYQADKARGLPGISRDPLP